MEQELQIIRRLRDEGYQAYFCGGCVRDRLLDREPKDWDVVTDALPEQVSGLFPTVIDDSQEYGVTFVKVPGGKVDVATMRRDVGGDGRHPDQVVYAATVGEDAQRRDFTINALYWEPVEDRVLDPTELGLVDLAAGRIRAVGDPEARFKEDYLRILRAYRFSVQLGFTIALGTELACLDLMPEITGLSRERVTDEMLKAFQFPGGLAAMQEAITALGGQMTHGWQDAHKRLLELRAPVELSVAMVGGVPFRLSNKQRNTVQAAWDYLPRARELADCEQWRLLEYMRLEDSYTSVLFQAALDGQYDGYYRCLDNVLNMKLREDPVVKGEDVQWMTPGPTRGEAIKLARRLQDAGATRESILTALRCIYG